MQTIWSQRADSAETTFYRLDLLAELLAKYFADKRACLLPAL